MIDDKDRPQRIIFYLSKNQQFSVMAAMSCMRATHDKEMAIRAITDEGTLKMIRDTNEAHEAMMDAMRVPQDFRDRVAVMARDKMEQFHLAVLANVRKQLKG